MLSLQMTGVFVLSFSFVAACGGSSPTGTLSGGDGGADGSMNGGDATASDSSPSPDTGVANDGPGNTQDSGNTNDGPSSGQDSGNAGDGPAAMPDAGDAASDAPAPPCPDVHGAYAVTAVDATGCGNSVNLSAPQCVRQPAMSCGITFRSMVSGGGNGAINGDATVQNDGSFMGAALMEGTSNRTGCTGTWNAANSTLTVDCGGTGSSQACVLALRRTGPTCN
jgi:hypothetical protein